MKRFFKRLTSIFFVTALLFVTYTFRDNIAARLFGSNGITWVTQTLSESLKQANELIVYDVRTSGIETMTQEALIIGVVQKVELPYDYEMCFSVDLSRAVVSVDGSDILIKVPSPAAGHSKLQVDKENMKKSDFLYRLTPERYNEICVTLEQKLFNGYAQDQACKNKAWEYTVENLKGLIQTILSKSGIPQSYTVQIIQDDVSII